MVDLVKFWVRISYLYARFTGTLNFEVDLKTGRTRVTRRATIYSAFASLFLISILAHHFGPSKIKSELWKDISSLHQSVFMIVSWLRVSCALAALASRWYHRRRYIRLISCFRRLFLQSPEVMRLCRRGFISKCFVASVAEIMQFLVAILTVWDKLTISMLLGIWGVMTVTAIMNVAITQYFFALGNARGHYILLNRQLRALLGEAQSLGPMRKRRNGVFITKCCFLADRLDEIAQTQSEVQALIEGMSKIYELQILCLCLTYYLTSVANIYILFSLYKYSGMTQSWSKLGMVASAIFFMFYYIDCVINSYNVFYLLDAHQEMHKLLEQRNLFPGSLDERLESAFDSFELSLARNPLNLKCFGLFRLNRSSAFDVGNSILINSVLLIQYDMQNY
ncbi:putative gustatory receptor 59d [Drosophila subobscura]|uniref:putative gustatory receptor 59d n=1 Tax=Drosophila subobscura TaxID=7241 RepID=UPI00155B289E|nr:putative gustatory receptor 59d [Drosophila subobscura]